MIFRHNIIENCDKSLGADFDRCFVETDQIFCNVQISAYTELRFSGYKFILSSHKSILIKPATNVKDKQRPAVNLLKPKTYIMYHVL